jgi:succinate dehydrogenase / fumarate reductase flavoprotein subunit
MQEFVGIVRQESEMREAIERLQFLRERANKAGIEGTREYNNGWHTAIDLHNLLTVSEAIAMAAVERKESRGAHFREDFPNKSEEFATFNFVIEKGVSGEMTMKRVPLTPIPSELQQVIEENK